MLGGDRLQLMSRFTAPSPDGDPRELFVWSFLALWSLQLYPARGSWYADDVQSNSEWTRDVEHLARTSPKGLVAALISLGETPESVRSMTSVTRGREEVRCGDWVVVRQLGEKPMAGRVEIGRAHV